jgi:hypothetical protein
MTINNRIRSLLQFSLLAIAFFAVSGCNPSILTSNSTQNTINNNSENYCPKKPPGSLARSNVKSISLAANEVNESGQIRFGQNLGYEFEAKAKQKLDLRTKENLCLYLYTPSNRILNDNILPENGKYIVQVAVPSGITTFSLAMKLSSDHIALNPLTKEPIVQQQSPQTSVPAPVSFTDFRVSFDSGSVGTSINGNINPSHVNRYLLDCAGGQLMSVRVIEGNINLYITDPKGRNIGRTSKGVWSGRLLMTGDYALEVSAPNRNAYKISVEVI